MEPVLIRERLQPGDAGVVQTLRWIVPLVQAGMVEPDVLTLSREILHTREKLDAQGQLQAVFDWIFANLRWIADPPYTELVLDVPGVIKNGGADCEELVMVAAALLGAAGFQSEIIVYSTKPGKELHHVVLRVPLADGYLYYDPSNPELTDGSYLKGVTRAWAVATVPDANGEPVVEDVTEQFKESGMHYYVNQTGVAMTGLGQLGDRYYNAVAWALGTDSVDKQNQKHVDNMNRIRALLVQQRAGLIAGGEDPDDLLAWLGELDTERGRIKQLYIDGNISNDTAVRKMTTDVQSQYLDIQAYAMAALGFGPDDVPDSGVLDLGTGTIDVSDVVSQLKTKVAAAETQQQQSGTAPRTAGSRKALSSGAGSYTMPILIGGAALAAYMLFFKKG